MSFEHVSFVSWPALGCSIPFKLKHNLPGGLVASLRRIASLGFSCTRSPLIDTVWTQGQTVHCKVWLDPDHTFYRNESSYRLWRFGLCKAFKKKTKLSQNVVNKCSIVSWTYFNLADAHVSINWKIPEPFCDQLIFLYCISCIKHTPISKHKRVPNILFLEEENSLKAPLKPSECMLTL